MNKQELIERIEDLKNLFGDEAKYIEIDAAIELIEQLDEYENGHADEAPRYVKNILARLRELPLHDREVWLKTIMSEFEQDFSRAKWREGYEQGKVEGLIEREKVTVKQFVADWIEKCKSEKKRLHEALTYTPSGVNSWISIPKNQETFARAWLDGYEVEKEKRYLVKMKNLRALFCYLAYIPDEGYWTLMASGGGSIVIKHTRKQLEEAGFGWVFNCEGIEIEEVEE